MFWYVATPYTRYPHGVDAAYRMACLEAANLLRLGLPVFSPIAHTHGIAEAGALQDEPLDYWLDVDGPFLRLAHGLIVVRADGWRDSAGVAREIAWFDACDKPVCYVDPSPALDTLPIVLRRCAEGARAWRGVS